MSKMNWNRKAKLGKLTSKARSMASQPSSSALGVEAAEVSAEHQASCAALCCSSRGERVCVLSLLGAPIETARLREMGLCEGAKVQVLRHGNPIVVRVADSRLGLAHSVAERVMVVPDVGEPQLGAATKVAV